MPSPTPNLGLPKPAVDSEAWDGDYYEAMDRLDAHPGALLVNGPGARPSSPFDGQVISRTDIPGMLEQYLNGSWHEISGDTKHLVINRTAFAILSGNRLAVARADGTVEYADNAILSDMNRAPWLTMGAVLAGGLVELLTFGEAVEPSWTWTPGSPLYLGAAGAMTQTPPVFPGALFSLQVGVAISATLIFFDPKSPIALA